MLRIYFNTLVPFSDRKKVIRAFKDLGFNFDREFVPGADVSHFIFRGRLPCVRSYEVMHLANFYFDDIAKKQFKGVDVSFIEIHLNFEKRGKS